MAYDPFKEMQETRNQLSYSKRIGFLLGAGTSKAIGISDINELTAKVINRLSPDSNKRAQAVKDCLGDPNCNLEQILDLVRLTREITAEKADKSYEGLDGETATSLDKDICSQIYSTIVDEEAAASLRTPRRFVTWVNWLGRDFTKEIFTLNYDLVLEKSLESMQVPFYDGFVGANEPFFLPESIDMDLKKDHPPLSWVRLWKLHGSLSWFWRKDASSGRQRIVRSGIAPTVHGDDEIVIYPTRDKYVDSRKQPYVYYFDRLRSYLLDGEGLFIVSGYSFRDPHVNTTIFDCLRHNNRLHMVGYFFTDETVDYLQEKGHVYMNFSAYGPHRAIVKGHLSTFETTAIDPELAEFWDDPTKSLLLGDFNRLVDFLLFSSGRRQRIESESALP